MPLWKKENRISVNFPNVREWRPSQANEALALSHTPEDTLRCPSACDAGNSTRLLAG